MRDGLLLAPPAHRGGHPSLAGILLGFALAFLGLALIFGFAFSRLDYGWDWPAVYAYRAKLLQGWFTTIWISAAALFLSIVVGLLCALAQRQRFLPLRCLARIYIEVIRGTPLLVQILIFFYVVADAFGVGNRYLVGILTLALFSGAYIAEIIRSGIESIGKSQWDSARAIGFTPAQTYRHVVFPQAVRQILPPLTGQFVSLIKDSSLLSIIAISEFTLNAQEINAFTFSTLESYLPLAVGYLILTLPVSWLTRHLEGRHRFET
ncbi:MAG: amino acid ABC transporter permease [Puniceicoccaceae bacterium]|nr:MAG: amino acid ABC transporter permease [Puniceicoccaceae bacterium]